MIRGDSENYNLCVSPTLIMADRQNNNSKQRSCVLAFLRKNYTQTKRAIALTTLISLISFVNIYSQSNPDTLNIDAKESIHPLNEIKGTVLDLDSRSPLAYANIYVLHKERGAISNEHGCFTINISGLSETDTLRFQYIGYKTKNITIAELDTLAFVYLKEDVFKLSETFIFGNVLNPVAIVKKVIKNKDSNYLNENSKRQCFVRERYSSDFDEIILNYKKSSISGLDREMIDLIQKKMPKHTTSYTDFLGYVYYSKHKDDSITFKVEPIRTVSLKEKDIAELKQLETIFESIFENTKEEEYWKIKSGIFSKRMEIDNEDEKQKKDSLKKDERKTSNYSRRLKYRLKYSLLDDKDEWEFLYSTGKYNYTLAGGTSVNGEEVYIIDFTPKRSGEYFGRLYISMGTYALIRADYEYAEGKTGTDFNMLGVGYTEDSFSGSIYFEKKNGNYVLKYFSKKAGSNASFNRNIAMLKKKERFLFDKKLNEIKIGMELRLKSEISFEILVLDETAISDEQFTGFEQKEKMKIIFVDQFDNSLWKGFSIIEPTEQMREYKKQKVSYSE